MSVYMMVMLKESSQLGSNVLCFLFFFFFNDTATTEIYTLSLHDALPISTDLVHYKSLRVVADRLPVKKATTCMSE